MGGHEYFTNNSYPKKKEEDDKELTEKIIKKIKDDKKIDDIMCKYAGITRETHIIPFK